MRLPIKLLLLTCAWCAVAASQQRSDTDDALLDLMIARNVLTTEGASPFHAVMEIRSEPTSATEHHGRVEVFWAAPTRYSLKVDAPEFHQNLVVDGERVQESDEGDFYPGWLQDFVAALLNPMGRASDLRGHPNAFDDAPNLANHCVKRDDRVNGITDDLTFAQICYEKALGKNVAYTLDFTHFLGLEDFQDFHVKAIAHTYRVSLRDDTKLRGDLTILEDWQPESARLTVAQPTPPSNRILTSMVSTAEAEGHLESAPKDVRWPPVREGKLDGYLIVHAITDRTGKVREAAPYNTDDNRELTPFVKQVALQYRFRPLVVDGGPRQMEMPLVLHFSTTRGEAIPELNDSESRKLITGCKVPRDIADPASAGQEIELILNINAEGHMGTGHSSDRKIDFPLLFRMFHDCNFGIYRLHDVPTQYHAHLSVRAH